MQLVVCSIPAALTHTYLSLICIFSLHGIFFWLSNSEKIFDLNKKVVRVTHVVGAKVGTSCEVYLKIIDLTSYYIFTLLYIIPSTQHNSLSYRYMFRLNKSSSGVSKNHKTNYNTPVHIWDPRWLTMCVGIRILRHYYLLLYLRVYWGWSVCCFLGLLFFDWGPGYVRRGFIVDRPPPTPSTGNWKAREKTTTDITRSPIKEQQPQ